MNLKKNRVRKAEAVSRSYPIPAKKYKKIVELVPILCVDVVVKNHRGEHLLVERANEPLKGRYWVIGGRVHKGENMYQAAIRKVKEEVGLKVFRLALIGYCEEMFLQNPFGLKNGVHTVSIVFSTVVRDRPRIRLDSQSTNWKYSHELPPDFRPKLFNARNLDTMALFK